MSKPTMVSLANELGVSRQTISNVINAPHLVKPETRARIQKHIEAAGYRPSAAARALRTKQSMRVGMRIGHVTDGINGAIMDRFVHATTEQLQARGYHPVLFAAADQAEELDSLARMNDSSSIDAAMITYVDSGDTRPDALQAMGLKFVAFGRPWGNPGATHPWVDVDNAVGVREATGHLRSLGHERIGFIGWGEESDVGAERLRGWAEGMAGLGIDTDQLLVRLPDGIREGVEGMRLLRERGATAAVCASDSFAIGASYVLRNDPVAGLDAGSSVFGFDDSPVAQALSLSSVAQPIEKVAAALVAQLFGRARGVDTSILLPSAAVPRSGNSFGSTV